MAYNIGDSIEVVVENKKYNGLIVEIKENYLIVIYVGKNSNGSAFAIMDDFDFNGNVLDKCFR